MKNTHLTLRLYRDKQKQFRWTLIASNGRKLANGGEAYKRRAAMEKAILLVLCEADEPFADIADMRPDIEIQDETAPAPRPHGHRCR